MDADGDGRTDLVLDSLPWNDTHTSQDGDSLVYSWPSAAPTLATWPGRGSDPSPVEGVRRTSQYVNFEDSGVAPSSGRLTIFDQNTRAGDFNGDGQEDLLRYDLPSDDYPLAPPTTGSLRLFLNVRSEHERVVLVRDGLGQEVAVAYEPRSNADVYRPTDDCYYPQRCSRSTNPLVASVAVGVGDNKHSTEYEYWDGREDVLGRGPLGFARTIVRDVPTGAVRIRLFDTVTVAGNHIYPHAGTPVIEVNVDTDKSSSTTPPSLRTVGSIRRFENVVHTHETAAGHRRDSVVRVSEEIDVFEDLASRSEEQLESPSVLDGLVPVSGAHTTMVYDGDANDPSVWDFPTETTTWTSDGLPAVVTSDYVPAGEDARWIAGRLERQYRTSGKGAPCLRQGSASWVYDPATGAMRAEERQSPHPLLTISEGERKTQFVRTEVDYDAFGNVTEQRVETLMTPRRTTTWDFGGDGWRVHSMTNDLGHKTQYEHHLRFGTPVAAIDPNGNRDEVLLDGFGRLAEHRSASGMDRERSYAWAPGTLPGMEVTDTYSDGSFRVTRLDEFGRLVRERRPGLQGGSPRDVLRRVDYDRVGRVEAVWEPIWDGESWTTENRAHRFDYNSVGMLRRETMPDGMVHEYTRGVESATFTDANDHRYEMHFDDRGNVVRSIEPGGAEQQFSWCLDGRLASTTGPTGVTDSNEYDAIGRLAAAHDSTRGSSTFGLDPFGNHLKITSPVATIGAEYDSLNRLIERTDADGTATFTYDVGPDAIGRLVESEGADGIRTRYGYDGMHLATHAVEYVDGTKLEFGYGYDSVGRLGGISYPRGAFKIGYEFADNGVLMGVTDDATGDPLWTAKSLTPRGLIELELLGDGSTTQRTYRPGSSRVTDIVGKASSGDVILDLGYGHDFSGAVTRLDDRLHSFVETFEYDDRGRMTDASSPEGPLKYTYDDLGNMTFASNVGTMKFDDPNRPYVPTYIDSVKQHYDDAGRFMGDDSGRNVSWTPFGAIRKFKRPSGGETTYLYDALGRRRLQVTPSGHRYRFDDYELDKNGDESIVIRAAGRVIATGAREPGQPMKLVYAHTDDLGSARVMTDEAGNVVEERVRAPFGDTYDVSWSTALPDTSVPGLRGLTGHREAGTLGIVEMGARDYDVGTKRMLSPDPIIARPLGIQGRHPYPYVWNQPRNFVDPLGMTPQSPTGAIESGEGLDRPPQPTAASQESAMNLDRPPGPPRMVASARTRLASSRGGSPPSSGTRSGPSRPEGDGGEAPPPEEVSILLPGQTLSNQDGQSPTLWQRHAREIARSYPNARVVRATNLGAAATTFRSLPENTVVRNVVFVGHGAPGVFGLGFQLNLGTNPLGVDLNVDTQVRAPSSNAASRAFWASLREVIASDGVVTVEFRSCYTGRDAAFLNEVDRFLSEGGVDVEVGGFGDFYWVLPSQPHTAAQEAVSQPQNTDPGWVVAPRRLSPSQRSTHVSSP